MSSNDKLALRCFCCLECSGAHLRLGTHVTFVRIVDLDSWKEKEKEVRALDLAGNDFVNSIYQAKLAELEAALEAAHHSSGRADTASTNQHHQCLFTKTN